MFPGFSYFIRFLNMEARIACNPITSLQAIKPTEQEGSKPTERERPKSQRNRNFSAKTFTTSTSEKTSIVCMFCKKKGHTLHRCCKIMEKPIEERVKFVQLEKLCFGCLKTGHNSKACTSRSVSHDSCGKCHPTCLHQDQEKKDQDQGIKPKQGKSNDNKGDKEQESKPIETQEFTQATFYRVVQEKSMLIPHQLFQSMSPQQMNQTRKFYCMLCLILRATLPSS